MCKLCLNFCSFSHLLVVVVVLLLLLFFCGERPKDWAGKAVGVGPWSEKSETVNLLNTVIVKVLFGIHQSFAPSLAKLQLVMKIWQPVSSQVFQRNINCDAGSHWLKWSRQPGTLCIQQQKAKERTLRPSEFMNCVKVEVAVLGSPS